MAEKDVVGKILFEYNDIFADAANALLFKGEQIVAPEDLTDAQPHSQYKADTGKLHQQDRDISKYWKKHGVNISVVGVENQTEAERDMPLRVIGYDGASYKSQTLAKGVKHFYPVITMVLYYGSTHWNYGRHLKDVLDMPDIVKDLVSDYEIRNLFEISFLDPETVKMFRSDFRIVADYFVQMRTNKEYNPSTQEIKHVDAVLKLLNVMTGKEWNNEFIDELKEKGEPVTMVSAYKGVYEKGRNQGISIGEERGRISVYYEDMKMSPEDISKKMNEPLDVVNKVIQDLKK